VNKELIEVAKQDEITLSNAMMYTVLDNDEISEIEIKIIKKFNQKKPSIKSFEFQIIDQSTLNKTNGIVQGMSGSPIIQNGKLVGAVTHVLINDPTQGYGIFIENMLNTMPEMLK
jgi:stage IV sporulation protein B